MDSFITNNIENILSDHHIHCGQFRDFYYSPSLVINTLYQCGVKKAWISSTSSCVSWNNEKEKTELIKFITNEIDEAVSTANELGIDLVPLYWVQPKRILEGEKIEDIMKDSKYKGFKIHPRLNDWSIDEKHFESILTEICDYASKNKMPILIHTDEDHWDIQNKFNTFYEKYDDVYFVLAHCKEPDPIINILSKYDNVYGDMAFCPLSSYKKICLAGYRDRLLSGTDFPITHWFERSSNNNIESSLIINYKKILKELKLLMRYR